LKKKPVSRGKVWSSYEMIEYPARNKYMITNKQIWSILVLVETQGGNKTNASKINRIFEEITKERDM
jgi:hypothetical protein